MQTLEFLRWLTLLSTPFVKQQAAAGLYTWQSTQISYLALCPSLNASSYPSATGKRPGNQIQVGGAPGGRNQGKQGGSPRHLASSFSSISSVSCSSARLRLISPVIIHHGVDYEHEKFQDKLNDALTLERTMAGPGSPIQQECHSAQRHSVWQQLGLLECAQGGCSFAHHKHQQAHL